MLVTYFLSLYQKFVSLNNQSDFEITPQVQSSSLTTFPAIKQHCFPEKKHEKSSVIIAGRNYFLFSIQYSNMFVYW